MRNIAIATLVLISFTLFTGCGGGSSKTGDNKNAFNTSKQGQTDKNNNKSAEQPALPEDFVITDDFEFIGNIANGRGTKSVGFKTNKPIKKAVDEVMAALVEGGWKVLDESHISFAGNTLFYKCSQDLPKNIKEYPDDARVYALHWAKEYDFKSLGFVDQSKSAGMVIFRIQGTKP